MGDQRQDFVDFDSHIPLCFKSLFMNNKIFCAPSSYFSSSKYGVIDLLMETHLAGDKWNFIIDSNVLIDVGNSIRNKEPTGKEMRSLAAILIALINGNLICDYALWETASVLGKDKLPQNVFDNVMLLNAVRSNPKLVENILTLYFSGKCTQNERNHLVVDSKKYETEIINWIQGNTSYVLLGNFRLFGNNKLILMILYADILRRTYLSGIQQGNDMFMSFIKLCEESNIPFNSRAVFTGAAVCTGYLNSAVKKRGFKLDIISNDKFSPKRTSIQDVVNMAFDLAICDAYDTIKNDGKFVAVLSSDDDLCRLLAIGYLDGDTGLSVSDFDYWHQFDSKIFHRVREFKDKTDNLNLKENDLWDMVGKMSVDYFWSDAEKMVSLMPVNTH
jgi:hypothetical protein